MTVYADQNEASPSLRPAAEKVSPLFMGSWKSNGVVPHADQNEASTSLGAANCETDVTFGATGRSSGVTSHVQQNETSTSLGAAKCETLATLLGFRVAKRRDVLRGPERVLAGPGACEQRHCRHVRGLLGAQRRDDLRGSE